MTNSSLKKKRVRQLPAKNCKFSFAF